MASIHPSYVACYQDLAGEWWFCADRYTDEWTPRLGDADHFMHFYDAVAAAARRNGIALAWPEAHDVAHVAAPARRGLAGPAADGEEHHAAG